MTYGYCGVLRRVVDRPGTVAAHGPPTVWRVEPLGGRRSPEGQRRRWRTENLNPGPHMHHPGRLVPRRPPGFPSIIAALSVLLDYLFARCVALAP